MALIKGTQIDLATESARGVAEIATQAETDAGTDDARIVTPLKLATYARLAGATPSAPAAGYAREWARTFADRVVPGWIDEYGLHRYAQAALWAQDWGMWMPGAPGVEAVIGMAGSVSGSSSQPTPATTSTRTRMRRLAITQTAGTDASCSMRSSARGGIWLGDAAGVGGFFCVFRFGLSTNLAGQRAFVGFLTTTGATGGGTNPSAFTECIGMAFDDTGDNTDNWQIMHNDGSGTCTTVDLGSNFQRNTTSVYELVLFAVPNATSVEYAVKNLETGNGTTGTLSSNLPAGSSNLLQHVWTNSGSTNGAPGIDMGLMYYEVPRYGDTL